MLMDYLNVFFIHEESSSGPMKIKKTNWLYRYYVCDTCITSFIANFINIVTVILKNVFKTYMQISIV